ncbi:hypothetical protein CERZMDRAFT_31337 [Cercospora zeae-maydis SCOH1-5]|uniref:HAUS augmin-like complex subunit 3 N-terminal domain-containing protein n=1 Tax=Cercospora zeae-maydis SCOH1-5 TaxID=717836 RepID=A0A6A6FVP7_9PEZI|nr:hypothetical protein CERZMDRAFT_31337 [Cercospora zeae-maydis SCOH1-5]
MSTPELRQLLRVLQARNIPLGEKEIAWAFEDSTTRGKAASWVKEYIGSATLLSKDELRFYEKHGISATAGLELSGRPLHDDEFEAAIDSLEASTAAIERQCQMLEQQKVALQKLKSHSGDHDAEFLAREKRHQKFTREKAQLDLEVDELSVGTNDRLRMSMKQTDAAVGSLDGSVNRLLEKDDRLLDGLQKLLPKLADASLEKDEAAKAEQLCSKLTEMSVQSIQARLDSTYRQTLLQYNYRGSPTIPLTDQQMKQRETLQAELEELSSEIEGLVTIVIDSQYGKSLKNGMQSARAEGQAQKAKLAEYTVAALVYLTSRLDAITGHVQHLHAHGAALRSVSKTLEEMTAVEQAKSGALSPTSPVRGERHTPAKGLKPLRLVQANLSDAQDPAAHFLREHDIRVADPMDTAKLLESLDTTVQEKQDKLNTLRKTTEDNITDAIVHSMAKSDSNLHDLLSAVYAHSGYGKVQLIDHRVQAELDKLENETQRIGDAMRELDIDGITRDVKRKQERALQKLGG